MFPRKLVCGSIPGPCSLHVSPFEAFNSTLLQMSTHHRLFVVKLKKQSKYWKLLV